MTTMNFNFEFYSDKLSPTYLSAIKNLQNNVNDSPDINKKIEYLKTFTEKYTTISWIWEEWARIASEHIPDTFETDDEIFEIKMEIFVKAQFHFFPVSMNTHIVNIFGKILTWKRLIQLPFSMDNGYKPKEHIQILKCANNIAFGIPHRLLKHNWKYYKQFSTAPVSKHFYLNYKKSLDLYKQFEAEKDDDEKWLNLLLTIDDEKCIIQNIEFKLGEKPWNQKIWKFYFEFLREKNYHQWLLDLYLRYCRFFIDDSEMREKYKTEIHRIEKLNLIDITKWKIDSIKFLADFNSIETGKSLMAVFFNENVTLENFNDVLKSMEEFIVKSDIQIYPNYAVEEFHLKLPRQFQPAKFESLFHQNFDLPKPLINFFLENANYKILSKLYSSCKYFYAKTKLPICHQMELGDFEATVSFQHSIFISLSDMDLHGINGLYLTNSLFVRDFIDPYTMSKIIPKIHKSDIKYFYNTTQILSLKEFKFLCSNVQHAIFFYSNVKDGEREVSFFEMIKFMPFIKKLSLLKKLPIFPPNFEAKDLKSVKDVKIKDLYIRWLSDLDDPELAYKLFIDTAAPRSQISFRIFENAVKKEILQNLIKNHSWISENEKPNFYLF